MKILLVVVIAMLCSTAPSAKTSAPAQRIIALSPHLTELLYSLDAGNRLVAVVDYSDYPADAKKLPRVGGAHGLQIEKIVALKPDLVLAWKGGNGAKDLARLDALGLRIYYSDITRFEDIARNIVDLGALLGQEPRAYALASQLTTAFVEIKARYRHKRSVRVFYQLWPQPLQSIGKGSWLDGLISVCGAENVFSSNTNPYPQILPEQVIAKNPEMIIIPLAQNASVNARSSAKNTAFWEKWPEIKAVACNQFGFVDGDLLHRFTLRAINGLNALCVEIDAARQASDNCTARID